MKTSLLALALTAGLALGPMTAGVHAQTTGTTAPATDAMQNIDAPTFALSAASGDRFEIASSQLAQQKSQNEQVKAFAQQMIKEHTNASAELKAAAMADKVQVPAEGRILERHADMLKQLGEAEGQNFDQLYMDMQSKAHDEAVALMGSFAASGEAPNLKAYAAKALPIVQAHKGDVQKLMAAK